MVIITFPDRDTQKRALGFLVKRFSGMVFKTGEHIVPEQAVKALAEKNFAFTVQGKANGSQVASLRSASAASLQRREGRAKRVVGRSRK